MSVTLKMVTRKADYIEDVCQWVVECSAVSRDERVKLIDSGSQDNILACSVVRGRWPIYYTTGYATDYRCH